MQRRHDLVGDFWLDIGCVEDTFKGGWWCYVKNTMSHSVAMAEKELLGWVLKIGKVKTVL